MKALYYILASMVISLSVTPAHAFSTDTSSAYNPDSSAKFQDPDEQSPFSNGSADGSAPTQPFGNNGFSFGFTAPHGDADSFQRVQENQR